MGKTKILNEIQEQIKMNFDTELDKLRKEMNSRQKQLRDQMEGLKAEAEKAMNERNEAHEELRRMKELLDKKRDQEGHQKKLLSAINKYAPPGENEYGEQKRAASRGGVNMNMYEKMFFDNGGKDVQLGGKSLKAESALLPVDHDQTITNYFHKGPYKKQEETFKSSKGGIPIFESSPEPLKKTNGYKINGDKSYGGDVEIPTINSNIKKQVRRDKIHYNYGMDSDDKTSIKADDTLDFINKINGVGAGGQKSKGSSGNKFGRQNSLSKKASEMKKNKLNESGFSVNSKNLAEKLDFDNFPALPDYEGIQSKFLKDRENKEDSYRKFESKAEPLNTSMLSDNTVPLKMTGAHKMRETTQSLGNGTSNTLKTINSINLEKLHNRNENRLADLENKYNLKSEDDELSKLESSYDHKFNYKDNNNGSYGDYAIKLDTNSNFMNGNNNDDYLRSIKEEKWEETFKKL